MHRTDVFGFRNRLARSDRLKRHAAFRTRPRMVLPNLGMHRAGIRRSTRSDRDGSAALRLGRLRRRTSYKAVRIIFEFIETPDATEMVRRTLVLKRSGALRWID